MSMRLYAKEENGSVPYEVMLTREGEKLADTLANMAKDGVLRTWTHTRTAGGVHNFEGYGICGKAKITATFEDGDTFAVNGKTVTAYAGAGRLEELPVGRWVMFIYDEAEGTMDFNSNGGGSGDSGSVSGPPSFSYTGAHQLLNDGGGNWRIKFLTSGTLTFTSLSSAQNNVEVFCVGGGGAGGYGRGGGGGGGYTTNGAAVLAKNTAYPITIGAGGTTGSATGGTTSALGVNAAGGYGGASGGTTGGSGGSGGGCSHWNPGNGGSNGGNGGSTEASIGGTGQGITTREFGEASGTLYAGGGGGGTDDYVIKSAGGSGGGGAGGSRYHDAAAGAANTGGGGGGAGPDRSIGIGGSGIVVIRNRRV